jgi:hypothetical protein
MDSVFQLLQDSLLNLLVVIVVAEQDDLLVIISSPLEILLQRIDHLQRYPLVVDLHDRRIQV